ncbi:MAG: DNA internalization-related competence protein ComEC/Rec2 [Panacagrimonas sp.]
MSGTPAPPPHPPAQRSVQDPRLLALAIALGVLAVHAVPQLAGLGLLLAGCVPALIPWRGRLPWSAAMLGVLAATHGGQAYLDQRWPASDHGQERELSGHVRSLPERAPGFGRDGSVTWRFDFTPIDEASPRRIRVAWYRSTAPVRAGECWTLRLRLRTPHGSFNPGGFDYEGWLYQHGITATATVQDASRCSIDRAQPVLGLRQAVKDHLDGRLGSHPGKALIAALAIGDDAGFSDHDWAVFRQTGTSHLVAISGFNVAIIAGLAFLLVRWTWPLSPWLAQRIPAQKAAMVLAALAGLAYGLLAGWESPAQRAALMLALLLLAALPDRRAAPSRVLALSFSLMLLVDPALILAPGFWLSFGAVIAIYYVTAGRIGHEPWWTLAIRLQVMLGVLLAPLTLYFFHGAAWLGLPVNLVAVPVMTVLTPVVMGTVGLSLAAPSLGQPLLVATANLMQGLQSGLAWLALHAPAAWIPASPPALALALALFGAALLFAPRGLPLRALGALCWLPMLWPLTTRTAAPFEVTALDVGQGLAVLVRTSHHALLYDAGPAFEDGFDAGESVVAPYVLQLGLRRVDRLFLSHGDRDHAGGVPAVRRLLHVADELGTPGHEPCRDGQTWTWDGVVFSVLHPDETGHTDNNRSCVLRVSAPGFAALLTGDIEREAEIRLLTEHPDLLPADLLIAPHHGSGTSSTPAFVSAVGPRLVIYGAGWRNYYRHPRPEVVARYADVGARQLVTGVEGAVRVWRDGNGRLQTESWRHRAARFWNAAAES